MSKWSDIELVFVMPVNSGFSLNKHLESEKLDFCIDTVYRKTLSGLRVQEHHRITVRLEGLTAAIFFNDLVKRIRKLHDTDVYTANIFINF
jgi:hypothetical protein